MNDALRTETATVRHLLAAERALVRARRSMRLADQCSDGPDLAEATRALEKVSLILQAERLEREL